MGAHGAMFINQNRSPNGTCDREEQGDDVLFQCSDPSYTTGCVSPHSRCRRHNDLLEHLQYLLTDCVQGELGDNDRACVWLVRYLRVVVRLARARHALPRKLPQKRAYRVSHSDLTYSLCLCRFVRA